ncbi:MAG TPA: hypothetical protein VHA35_12895 [Dongiaceae bacterium]|nr:hypothetical protein [Dongiaceae bacterium]
MAVFGLAAIAVLALAAAAHAEDKGKSIDCSDIAMRFSAPGYSVKCTDYSNNNVSDGYVTTGVRTEVLEADSDDHRTYLAAVDQRVLGDYSMRRYSMIDDVRSYFNEQHIDDWTPVADFAGFQMANYTSRTDSGAPIDCIAFRREVTRRNQGVGRLVVGISCTLRSRDEALDALKKLDAPGG